VRGRGAKDDDSAPETTGPQAWSRILSQAVRRLDQGSGRRREKPGQKKESREPPQSFTDRMPRCLPKRRRQIAISAIGPGSLPAASVSLWRTLCCPWDPRGTVAWASTNRGHSCAWATPPGSGRGGDPVDCDGERKLRPFRHLSRARPQRVNGLTADQPEPHGDEAAPAYLLAAPAFGKLEGRA
jgi:hypothetical protein